MTNLLILKESLILKLIYDLITAFDELYNKLGSNDFCYSS